MCRSIDDFDGFCDDGYVSWEIYALGHFVHAVLVAPARACTMLCIKLPDELRCRLAAAAAAAVLQSNHCPGRAQ